MQQYSTDSAPSQQAPAAVVTPQPAPARTDRGQTEEATGGVFTFRAFGLGLLGGTAIASYAYFNDWKMQQNYLVGNHLPLMVYAPFFVFLLFCNPLLRRFDSSVTFAGVLAGLGAALFGVASLLVGSVLPLLIYAGIVGLALFGAIVLKRNALRPFSGGELAIVLGMTLVCASLPTSGLMRNMPQILTLPQYYGKSIPDWEKADPLQYVLKNNANLFPVRDPVRDPENKVYDGFVQGIRKGRDLPPLKETGVVEWVRQGSAAMVAHLQELKSAVLWAWIPPVLTWFPILILYFVCLLSLCRIVHRQWSENEQLSYPIAEFANALMRNEQHRMFSDVFYSRCFWIAFAGAMIYNAINALHAYFPGMIEIRLSFDLGNIFQSKMQFLQKGLVANTYSLYYGHIFLTVVAFAYFLPEEISLSIGLGVPALVFSAATCYAFGHQVTAAEHQYMLFGSYFAMAGVILYTGRYYYLQVFKRALCLPANSDDVDRGTMWACRWFLLSTAGLVVLLMNIGLDWMLACSMVLVIGVIFMVLARASAEAGVPFMQSNLMANTFMMALFGPAALGPACLYILQLVSTVFMQDNRECLAPFAINAFRLGERNNVNLTRFNWAMILVLSVGLFAAGVGVLYVVYDQGVLRDGYMGAGVPQGFAKDVSREIQKLKRGGNLESSLSIGGVSRITQRDSAPTFLTFFAVGLALVLANSALRLRYVWWPLHPVMFLFWGTWAVGNFTWSFLLGWLVKRGIVRFGGGKVYQDLKPAFIGIIIGELTAGMIIVLIGTVYYIWTGSAPIRYSIFPG